MRCILQTEASECGLACLAMVADHFGYQTDLVALRRRFSISLKGITLHQLVKHSATLGFSARPLRLEMGDIQNLRCPCILHWDLNHFVVLKKVRLKLNGEVTAIICDPAVGERRIGSKEVSRHFTGVALELTPTPGFQQKDERRRFAGFDLLSRVHGIRFAVAHAFALAVALEIFAICGPLFSQFVIDEVIVGGDRQLLTVLVLGFLLVAVIQTVLSLARSWFLMKWSEELTLQWSAKLFWHLIRLPGSYFEKRYLGDILSRFGSLDAIQRTFTNLIFEAALDGLMAVLSLAMMVMYSGSLTIVVVSGAVLYTVLRWVFYGPLKESSNQLLLLSAKEDTFFVETVRAIIPLKLFGRSAERCAKWQNLRSDVLNKAMATERLQIYFRASTAAISGVSGLTVFFLGAHLILDGVMTVGMLTAFSSYAATFTARIFNLTDLFVDVRLLGIHNERLADIALEECEEESESETDLTRCGGVITLRNVRFRYAEGEPWVLDGINISISSGQCVALIGPSGSGKTTLCKIILGLLKPTEGDVLIDGLPIRKFGIQAYRSLIGTVMQDDVLLAGNFIENISFFDPSADQSVVEICAKLASIHDEILAMPMGYQTLVGDMGSTLSGGQKQRVLLARALYKRPLILALDESTCHLDAAKEKEVTASLDELKLTKIMVAHRRETICTADRVFELKEARLIEISTVSDLRDTGCLTPTSR